MEDRKQTYPLPDGSTLAYTFHPGRSPGVIFLAGFMADMGGTKATFLQNFCERRGQSYLRFDYFGHGVSSGQLIEGSIGRWKKDVISVIDHLTTGPQILVGSSMGGWLMVLAALERSERIKALVGVASAPDFVKALIFDRLTPDQQKEIETKGVCYVPSPFYGQVYPITKLLIEESRQYEILGKPIALSCPVRLIHGVQDEEVPCSYSIRLMESLVSEDVRVTLIKKGDHRLNEESQLQLLANTLSEFFTDS